MGWKRASLIVKRARRPLSLGVLHVPGATWVKGVFQDVSRSEIGKAAAHAHVGLLLNERSEYRLG
jgi:hypothetical protein